MKVCDVCRGPKQVKSFAVVEQPVSGPAARMIAEVELCEECDPRVREHGFVECVLAFAVGRTQRRKDARAALGLSD